MAELKPLAIIFLRLMIKLETLESKTAGQGTNFNFFRNNSVH